jgi:hypothetical protein
MRSISSAERPCLIISALRAPSISASHARRQFRDGVTDPQMAEQTMPTMSMPHTLKMWSQIMTTPRKALIRFAVSASPSGGSSHPEAPFGRRSQILSAPADAGRLKAADFSRLPEWYPSPSIRSTFAAEALCSSAPCRPFPDRLTQGLYEAPASWSWAAASWSRHPVRPSRCGGRPPRVGVLIAREVTALPPCAPPSTSTCWSASVASPGCRTCGRACFDAPALPCATGSARSCPTDRCRFRVRVGASQNCSAVLRRRAPGAAGRRSFTVPGPWSALRRGVPRFSIGPVPYPV